MAPKKRKLPTSAARIGHKQRKLRKRRGSQNFQLTKGCAGLLTKTIVTRSMSPRECRFINRNKKLQNDGLMNRKSPNCSSSDDSSSDEESEDEEITIARGDILKKSYILGESGVSYNLRSPKYKDNSLITKLKTGSIPVFKYCDADLSVMSGNHPKGQLSKFEKKIICQWKKKNNGGTLRYKINYIPTRTVTGKFPCVIQLNKNRTRNRRQPEYIKHISIAFNKKFFHFGKVPVEEVIFMLENTSWPVDNANIVDSRKRMNMGHHALIVNASPIGKVHCLLCPFVNRSMPQILVSEALILAVEVLMLTRFSHFRVIFNSLGAHASVNNLHFHLYELKHGLYVEKAPVVPLSKHCYSFKEDYPPAFIFQVTEKDDDDYLPTVERAMLVISLLKKKKVSYNIYMTKALPFNQADNKRKFVFSGLRIYIWPRYPVLGQKDEKLLNTPNMASCELAGHFIFGDKRLWKKSMNKKYLNKVLEEDYEEHYSLFNNLIPEVLKLAV